MPPAPRPAPHRLRADRASPVAAVRAGLVPYAEAWDLQGELVERRRHGGGDVLVTLQHPPVFTLGRRSDPANVLWSPAERAARGIELHRVDRGGDVTYHGPGQLVAYPILRLAGSRAVVPYVRALEEVCIRAVARLGVRAQRVDGRTGVWVGQRKLAAIGVRVAAPGITSHGLALNVAPDLAHFDGIVPCGIADAGVCSLRSLGVEVGVPDVRRLLVAGFAAVFGCSLEEQELSAVRPPVEAVR